MNVAEEAGSEEKGNGRTVAPAEYNPVIDKQEISSPTPDHIPLCDFATKLDRVEVSEARRNLT